MGQVDKVHSDKIVCDFYHTYIGQQILLFDKF